MDWGSVSEFIVGFALGILLYQAIKALYKYNKNH